MNLFLDSTHACIVSY